MLDPLTRLLGSLYKPYHGFQGYSWEGNAERAALKPHRPEEPLEARGSRNLSITTGEIQDSAHGITLMYTFMLWVRDSHIYLFHFY